MNSNGNKPTAIGDQTVEMRRLKLTKKNEGFPNGKSELRFAVYRSGAGSCNNGSYFMSNLGKYGKSDNPQGIGSDVPWLAPLTNNFALTTPFSEKITVLFFERDRKKKHDKIREVVLGCPNTKVSFRSRDEPYGRMTIHNPRIANPFFQYSLVWDKTMDGLQIENRMY